MAKVRKAVITAAGRGTRQYPASTAVQKEMFPLVDRDGLTKPVIQIIGEEAIDAGIEQICIVTQPGEERQYREYFRRMSDADVKAYRGKDWAILESEKLAAFGERLHFAEQHTPEGFGHAVYQAKKFVGDEPFLLGFERTKHRSQRAAADLMQDAEGAEGRWRGKPGGVVVWQRRNS